MNAMQKISDAASIAIHAMVYLGANKGRIVRTGEIADRLMISKDHLSKVLQRLTKAGYVKSIRGPSGGFDIEKKGESASLLKIYELIDGPMQQSVCILGTEACNGEACIFGDLVTRLDTEVREYFSETKISDLAPTFMKGLK